MALAGTSASKCIPYGKVEKTRQRGSRSFAVLTYWEYAPRAKRAAALLDGIPASARTCFLNIPVSCSCRFRLGHVCAMG